jgi:hypothetical protein
MVLALTGGTMVLLLALAALAQTPDSARWEPSASTIDPATLPLVVRTMLDREWPTATRLGARLCDEGIEVLIEDEGVRLAVTFAVNSTWSEVAKRAELTALPAAVQRAAKALGKAMSATELRGPAGTVTYEVVIAKGKKLDRVRFDAGGAKLSVQPAAK